MRSQNRGMGLAGSRVGWGPGARGPRASREVAFSFAGLVSWGARGIALAGGWGPGAHGLRGRGLAVL